MIPIGQASTAGNLTSERKITLPFLYERVNLYCAGVNSTTKCGGGI